MRLVLVLAAVLASPALAQTLTLAPADPQADKRFGEEVAAVPDVTGDGVDDLAVGTPYYTDDSGASSVVFVGRVDVYDGADGSLVLEIVGEVENGSFGAVVAGIGDVNGDGKGDLVVGSPYDGVGSVSVRSGATGAELYAIPSPGANVVGTNFGFSVGAVPDVTGDGIPDVLVGGFVDGTDPGTEGGGVHIYDGVSGAAHLTIRSLNAESGGSFGVSVAGRADLDGDGFGDLVVGASNEEVDTNSNAGRAYVYSGRDGDPLLVLESPNSEGFGGFGRAVAVIPDANGDGVDDVAVGTDEDVDGVGDAGRVYVFSGADGALISTIVSPNPTPDGNFGFALAGITDAVGAAAVLVGAFSEDAPSDGEGRAYVFRASDGALASSLTSPTPKVDGQFGRSVAAVGGAALVGAPLEDSGVFVNQQGSGSAHLFVTLPGGGGDDVTASVSLDGPEGWRLLSAPVGVSGQTLFADLYTQGVRGGTSSAGGASVYDYDESVSGGPDAGFVASDLRDSRVGAGYAIYVFEDDDPYAADVQVGFPKTLDVTGPEAVADVGLPASFTDTGVLGDDGWNLLGNPFPLALDWDHPDWTKTNVDNVIYVYDPADQTYKTWNGSAGGLGDGVIAPFQGFWVKAFDAPTVTAPVAGQTADAPPVAPRTAAAAVLALRVEGTQGGAATSDAAYVAFLEGAAPGLDRLDAYELAPFRTSYVALYAGADGAALDITALPAPNGTAEVPLGLAVVGEPAGDLRLTWPALDVPDAWAVSLTDTETGAVVDLREADAYPFEAASTAGRRAEAGPPSPTPLAAGAQARRSGPRFVLTVASAATAGEATPDAVFGVEGVWPNPTTGRAVVAVGASAAGPGRLTLHDALGREVAVLADGPVAAGRLEVAVDTALLAAGVYLVRWAAGGDVASATLTVLR